MILVDSWRQVGGWQQALSCVWHSVHTVQQPAAAICRLRLRCVRRDLPYTLISLSSVREACGVLMQQASLLLFFEHTKLHGTDQIIQRSTLSNRFILFTTDRVKPW